MLIIRKEQMAVFEKHLDSRFHTFLRKHIREYMAVDEKDLSNPGVDELIKLAISRASSYRVTMERDIAMFLDLMILKGRDFDSDPKLLWARKILDSKDSDGSEKMQKIYRRLEAFENRKPLPEETL